MLFGPLQLSAELTADKTRKCDSTSVNIEILYIKHEKRFPDYYRHCYREKWLVLRFITQQNMSLP